MRVASLLITLLTILIALPAPAQPRRTVVYHRPARAMAPSPFQFLFEGGAALPQGDLADAFIGTERGLGASTGYELGVRLRYYVGATTAVGPCFHWVDFGDWEDVDAQGTPYAVRTSLYRYGLDIHQFLAAREAQVRPFLTIGGALVHNRYQDWIQTEGTFDATSTNLSFAAGGGIAMGPVELSVTWNYNPAEFRQLVPVGADDAFDWSWLSVRGALAFGR